MTVVYISGRITGNPGYKEEFHEAEQYLRSMGYATVNPAKLDEILPKDTAYTDFVKVALAMLDTCDVIHMIPGWEKSKGATLEKKYAEAMGKMIL